MEVYSETCKKYFTFFKEKYLYSLRIFKATSTNKSERVISINFSLLFNTLTQLAIDIIHQASTYDYHLFNDYQTHHKALNNLRELSYLLLQRLLIDDEKSEL